MRIQSLSMATLAAAGALAAAAPLQAAELRIPATDGIAGQYIVVLDRKAMAATVRRDGLAGTVQTLLTRVGGGQVIAEYGSALLGFAARISRAQAEALALQPGVTLVEQDQTLHADATSTQTAPTWGLDRIDQRPLPLDGLYIYPAQAGAGAHVYVLDTGLNASHVEFAGRIGNGRNFASNARFGGLFPNRIDPANTSDCDGHGSHVSGTAVGASYGVAKRATIHPVRVLGCTGSGSNSGVIAGVDWVAANAIAPAVANMSLGGGASAALDAAVGQAIAAGVVFAVSAGNSNRDACTQSPARTAAALTVGATDSDDGRASYSNFGACVDLFAPGTSITSAAHNSSTGTRMLSGTSMSSPHVAGAAALLRAANPTLGVDAIVDSLLADATLGLVGDAGAASPNVLLHVRR